MSSDPSSDKRSDDDDEIEEEKVNSASTCMILVNISCFQFGADM